MVWAPADGAGPAGQFHASEMLNVLRAIDGLGVYGHTLSVTITGADRNITVPAFTARVPDGSGGTTVVSYAGGTVASTTADATNPRTDIVVVNSSGTVSVTAGTPTAESGNVVEAPMPALGSNELLLLKCRRPANTNAITTSHLYGRAIDISEIVEQKGSDVASASTLTLPAGRNYFHITGTTTITAIATRPAGEEVTLEFDGALLLTHNATSLIMLDGANVTTVAGQVFRFVSEGSGNWRQVSGPVFGKQYKYKTASQDFTTTTLADVTATSGTLSFAVAANTAYEINFEVYVSAIGTVGGGGLKYAITFPASPTYAQVYHDIPYILSDGTPSYATGRIAVTPTSGTAFFSQVGGNAGSSNGVVAGWHRLKVIFINGSTAGTLTLQAAQNTATGTTTIAEAVASVELIKAAS